MTDGLREIAEQLVGPECRGHATIEQVERAMRLAIEASIHEVMFEWLTPENEKFLPELESRIYARMVEFLKTEAHCPDCDEAARHAFTMRKP
jgi:hypothetical protein